MIIVFVSCLRNNFALFALMMVTYVFFQNLYFNFFAFHIFLSVPLDLSVQMACGRSFRIQFLCMDI